MALARGLTVTIAILLLVGCFSGQKKNNVKTISFMVAPKTSRRHIITETTVTLNMYNFTVQYANSTYDYKALRTHWREGREAPIAWKEPEDALGVRDRAILHLSPRGQETGGGDVTLVASTLQFEMQKRDWKKKKWVYVTPDSVYLDQYRRLVGDLRDRLRKRGYIFN